MALLNADQAAAYLHLNVKRVQALARAGRLPGRRVGRKWLFDQRDLESTLGRSANADNGASAGGLDVSARNQLRGRVLDVNIDGLMAEVRIGIGDQELIAVITRNSVERLDIRVGEPIVALIKSTEVMVAKGSVP